MEISLNQGTIKVVISTYTTEKSLTVVLKMQYQEKIKLTNWFTKSHFQTAQQHTRTLLIATSIRADAVLLVRLRAGHTPLLKAYAHLLDPAADPTCPLCKEEPQTLEHWL